MEISDLHLEYVREDLAFGRLHLKLLRLNLRELHIVESHEGRTNLIDFLSRAAPETLGGSGKSNRGYTLAGIDMLNLSVGKVRYTNLRLPGRNQDIQVGLQNEIIPNVRTEEDLAGILFRVLLRAGITIYMDHPSLGPLPRKAI